MLELGIGSGLNLSREGPDVQQAYDVNSLGAAMDALIRPAFFPVIEISLSIFQALEAFAPEWRFCAWATPDSTFPFRSGSRTLQGSAVTP